ncbi:hypothetical protein F3Y30_03950 [Sinorhizobium sp. BG8]|nr:hypothetical protein F3Y30_03950 [Sinorhizobium sp. BG8]
MSGKATLSDISGGRRARRFRPILRKQAPQSGSPLATKPRLGLDDERSWTALTESNSFVWPEADMRPLDR